jgi:hypothetical protein
MGDDSDASFTVPIFTWGGVPFSSLNISSNGYITMGDLATDPNNQSLPDSSAPSGVLAPYWTDLDPSTAGTVSIATLANGVSDWIVVDWENVPIKGQPSTSNSFETWIGINGVEDINFQYGDLSSPAPGALTVGAENIQGNVGTNYYYNGTGTLPVSNTDLTLTTSDTPNLVPEPVSGSVLREDCWLSPSGDYGRKRRAEPAAIATARGGQCVFAFVRGRGEIDIERASLAHVAPDFGALAQSLHRLRADAVPKRARYFPLVSPGNLSYRIDCRKAFAREDGCQGEWRNRSSVPPGPSKL